MIASKLSIDPMLTVSGELVSRLERSSQQVECSRNLKLNLQQCVSVTSGVNHEYIPLLEVQPIVLEVLLLTLPSLCSAQHVRGGFQVSPDCDNSCSS